MIPDGLRDYQKREFERFQYLVCFFFLYLFITTTLPYKVHTIIPLSSSFHFNSYFTHSILINPEKEYRMGFVHLFFRS
ncbi:hypothetical protein BO94DRAFT_204682 [Aspergillus sclerotioniger CBS 115572]|uniref:Uncharacterized protein n=1 Tax=Aspergillus sclerotioniger CBS 115572 TaxID=1450535 RepID=A0A317VTW2_9EURO|nr:hypothetical protein BO94DRAFT_204682 [Aspergillus sclerotioniger CBS 115572]PWY76467.1 hypothetical protein BO94DRAFT_204682 [Aspergillus sclerotioniger CBS 115572]